MKVAKQITDALKQAAKKPTAYDTTATVNRVEGNTAWVHIPGGVDETPVKLTIAAKPGDLVQVRVSGGSAWIAGNTTSPPTDDTMAKRVRAELDTLKDAAFRAIEAVRIMARHILVQDANGNVLAEFDADTRLANIAGWIASDGILSTTLSDRIIEINATTGEIVIKKLQSGHIVGDIIISKDEISFGVYDNGNLWYRNSLTVAADGQRGTLEFDSGAPYGGQIGVVNYDNNSNTLYTGMTDISGIGDGTITGAISALLPTTNAAYSQTVSVPSGTATTVASITLKKGIYILDGAASFAKNSTGYRQLHFSYSDAGGFINRFAGTRVAAASGDATWVEAMFVVTIASDNTTVYLVANQNSGNSLNAASAGIMITALDGGGLYAGG